MKRTMHGRDRGATVTQVEVNPHRAINGRMSGTAETS